MHNNYQPLYTKEGVTNCFERDCKDRYTFLYNTFNKFKRPFTVLDIGANLSYFGRRILEDFPNATVISVEKDASILTRGMTGYPLLGLNTKIDSDIIKKWSTYEMFDVVLCLSVLHHLPKPEAIKTTIALLQLGFEVYIEIPGKEDIAAGIRESNFAVHELLENFNVPKAYFPSPTTRNVKRPTYMFTNFGKYVFAQWVNECGGSPFDYGVTNKVIWRGYDKVPLFLHSSGIERDWLPGINLHTLEHYNGYVSGESMSSRLAKIKLDKPHGDIVSHNVIVSKDVVKLIDYGHRNNHDDKMAFEDLIKIGDKIKTV